MPLPFLPVLPSRFPLWDWSDKNGLIWYNWRSEKLKQRERMKQWKLGQRGWKLAQAFLVSLQQIRCWGFPHPPDSCFLPCSCPVTVPIRMGFLKKQPKTWLERVIVILLIFYGLWSRILCNLCWWIGSEYPGCPSSKPILTVFNNMNI